MPNEPNPFYGSTYCTPCDEPLSPAEQALLQQEIEALQAALAQEIADRIAAIETLSGLYSDSSAAHDAIQASVTQQITAITTDISAFAQLITTVQASMDDNIAQVQTITTAVTNLTQSVTSQINTLTSTFNGNIATLQQSLGTQADDIEAVSQLVTTLTSQVGGFQAALVIEGQTRQTDHDSLALLITTLTASLADVSASVTQEIATRVDNNQALSQVITTLTASFGGTTATMVAELLAYIGPNGVVNLAYNLIADPGNGRISGIKSETNLDYSHFDIIADSFRIVTPTLPGGQEKVPFQVTDRGLKTTSAIVEGKLEAGELGADSPLYNTSKNPSTQQLLYDGYNFPSTQSFGTAFGNQNDGTFKLGYVDSTGASNRFRNFTTGVDGSPINANVSVIATLKGVGYGSAVFDRYRVGKAGYNQLIVGATAQGKMAMTIWGRIVGTTIWYPLLQFQWGAPVVGTEWHSIGGQGEAYVDIPAASRYEIGVNSLNADGTPFSNTVEADNYLYIPLGLVTTLNY